MKTYLVTQQRRLPYRCGYILDTNVFLLKVIEYTIGESLFEIFVNLHLIINNKEIKNAHYF